MEKDEELRKTFSKILGAPFKRSNIYDYDKERTIYSWEEIFTEIGKLQERAEKPTEIKYIPSPSVIPLTGGASSPVHYHNGSPCYNNPCVWCSGGVAVN